MRWKCVCAYDGTDYAGWQSQVTGRAIQDVIEQALGEILGHKTRIHGSGRTDAGVHAKGQVFHFDDTWKHGGEALRKAFATALPSAWNTFAITLPCVWITLKLLCHVHGLLCHVHGLLCHYFAMWMGYFAITLPRAWITLPQEVRK